MCEKIKIFLCDSKKFLLRSFYIKKKKDLFFTNA